MPQHQKGSGVAMSGRQSSKWACRVPPLRIIFLERFYLGGSGFGHVQMRIPRKQSLRGVGLSVAAALQAALENTSDHGQYWCLACFLYVCAHTCLEGYTNKCVCVHACTCIEATGQCQVLRCCSSGTTSLLLFGPSQGLSLTQNSATVISWLSSQHQRSVCPDRSVYAAHRSGDHSVFMWFVGTKSRPCVCKASAPSAELSPQPCVFVLRKGPAL